MPKVTTKTQLLASAMRLFRESGYDRITIDDICKSVGITRGAFYYHFRSKEELLADFLAIPESIGMEHLSNILAAPNHWEQLWLCLLFYLDYTREVGPEILSQILRLNLAKDRGTYRIKETTAKIAYPIIEKGQAAGQIRNATPARELYFIAAQLLMAYDLQWAIADGGFDKLPAMRGALEALLDVEPSLRKGGSPIF